MTDEPPQITKDEVTLKFMGRVKEGARWMYSFENPKDAKYPFKFSAFDPDTPKLDEGVSYKMTIAHVPIKDAKGQPTGKFYHNLFRKDKDSPYLIAMAGGDIIRASEIKPSTSQPAQAQNSQKDEFWSRREKRDIDREPVISRYAALERAILALGPGKTEDEYIKLSESFKKYAEKGLNGKAPHPSKDGPEAFSP